MDMQLEDFLIKSRDFALSSVRENEIEVLLIFYGFFCELRLDGVWEIENGSFDYSFVRFLLFDAIFFPLLVPNQLVRSIFQKCIYMPK